MSRPPHIHKATSLFAPESKNRGNKSLNHAEVYNTKRWKELRKKRMNETPMTCEWPDRKCIALATVLDHIIPINQGGSKWDRLNHQKLCDKHHNMKRGRESNGNVEPSIGTPTGRIPERNKGLISNTQQ